MRAETPSEVLFDFLKCDLQINNREAARILISDKPMGSKPAPRFRIADKTFLSRRVVHVVPGTDKIDPEMFADFSQSVQSLAAAVKIDSDSSPVAANARQQAITAHALERMATSLEHWGLDGSILRNIFDRIAVMTGLRQSKRHLLELLALTVCGCLADPNAAASEIKDFAITQLAQTFGTLETGYQPQGQRASYKTGAAQACERRLGLTADLSFEPRSRGYGTRLFCTRPKRHHQRRTRCIPSAPACGVFQRHMARKRPSFHQWNDAGDTQWRDHRYRKATLDAHRR